MTLHYINDTMSDDEVVASDVPPRNLFLFLYISTHLKRVCGSLRLSIPPFVESKIAENDNLSQQGLGSYPDLLRISKPAWSFSLSGISQSLQEREG